MLSRRKFLALMGSAAVSTVALSACGTQATPTPKGETLPANVTITDWVQANASAGEGYRATNLETGGQRVTEKLGGKTTIKVESTVDNSGWGPYAQKVQMAYDSKTGPDILCTGHEYAAAYSENGYILALDDMIKKYPATYDDIIPNLWNPCTYKGKRWCIPQDCEARPLYYSKPALKKLGWSDADIAGLPDKIKSGQFILQDILDTSKQMMDKGIVAKGAGFFTRGSAGNDWYEFYYSFGGETQDASSGKLVFSTDAWTKHYTFFYNAFNTLGVSRKDLIGASTSKVTYPEFLTTNVGFYFGGTWWWNDWAVNYVKDKGGEQYLFDNIGYALIPAATKGGKPTTVTHPLIYMLSAQSKYPETAFRIITEACANDLNTLHAVGSSHLGINKSQVNFPAYAAAKFLQSVTYMLDYSRFIPNHPKWAQYDTATWAALQGVASGDFKPEQAVKVASDQIKAQIPDDVMFK